VYFCKNFWLFLVAITQCANNYDRWFCSTSAAPVTAKEVRFLHGIGYEIINTSSGAGPTASHHSTQVTSDEVTCRLTDDSHSEQKHPWWWNQQKHVLKTDVEISHLADVEISHLVDVEISHLVDVEISHLVDVEISGCFTRIWHVCWHS